MEANKIYKHQLMGILEMASWKRMRKEAQEAGATIHKLLGLAWISRIDNCVQDFCREVRLFVS